MENGHRNSEIVDLPMKNGDVSIVMLNYQRVLDKSHWIAAMRIEPSSKAWVIVLACLGMYP
jgi:hypothetical protein